MKNDNAHTAQVLEDAADLLLVYGRSRGKAMTETGAMCVRGAILVASGVDLQPGSTLAWGKQPHATEVLEQALAADPSIHADRYITKCRSTGTPKGATTATEWTKTLELGRWPAWLWNDDLDTSDDEVRDTLLAVAKDLRNEVAS